MRIDGKSTRFYERSHLKLPIEVTYRESEEREWTEKTLTDKLTICGIGFLLSRPVEPKRLIKLKLPMPRRFRLFDYAKEQYEVWGIVRYLQMAQAIAVDSQEERISLIAGVALIGATPPASFLLEPKTLYDLKPILRDKSFWDWRESPRRTGRYVRSYEERRPMRATVVLQVVDSDGLIVETVAATTLNISESGAAVRAEIKSGNPEYILIKAPDESFSLLALVRGVHHLEETNFFRLHLEFISGKWAFDLTPTTTAAQGDLTGGQI